MQTENRQQPDTAKGLMDELAILRKAYPKLTAYTEQQANLQQRVNVITRLNALYAGGKTAFMAGIKD